MVQRVQSAGVRSAAGVDLIAVGLSRREQDAVQAEPLARSVISRFGSLYPLGDASPEDLRDLAGLEGFEAIRVLALLELGRRIGGAGKRETKVIQSARDIFELLEFLRREKKEYFYAVLLDTKNTVIRALPIHIGTLSMSVVGPREVFREAIREAASSIIVAHNHPSGDPTPSPDDMEITLRLKEIGDMLDIPVLDHVIIGERRYVSLKERRSL